MKNENKGYQNAAFILIGIGVFITTIYFILLYQQDIISQHLKINLASVGAFGDFIGGVVGSIWTLAGVFLFVQALNEQRKDVKTNIEMLELQVQTLEESQKMHEQQVETMMLQQFENTFFSLISMFQDNINKLSIKSKTNESDVFYGKNCFGIIEKEINENSIFGEKAHTFFTIMSSNKHIVNAAFKRTHHKYQFLLDPYIHSFKRVLEFIDDSDLSEVQKIKYAKIFRSQFTQYELLVIYYYCQTKVGNKFQEKVWRYNFFKELRTFTKIEYKGLYQNIDKYLKKNDIDLAKDFDIELLDYHISKFLEYAYVIKGAETDFHTFFASQFQVSAHTTKDSYTLRFFNFYKSFDDKDYTKDLKRKSEILSKIDFVDLLKSLMASKLIDNNFNIAMDFLLLEEKKKINISEEIEEDKEKGYTNYIITFKYLDKDYFKLPIDIDSIIKGFSNLYKTKDIDLKSIKEVNEEFTTPPPNVTPQFSENTILLWD